MTRRTGLPSRALVVSLVAAAFATVVIVGELAAQRPDCCAGKPTVARMYSRRDSGIDRLLVTGDAQAFAALAQDPLLARPAVFGSASELAYRAQRPAWGYAAWALSLGRPHLAGWALVLLAILACGAAAYVAARLLEERGASPWWGLVVIVAGMETVTELTPELAAFALFGAGLLLWSRDRRVAAVLALCAAVATRETMLVGVAALAAWEVWGHRADGRAALRRVAVLGWPFATFAGWALVLRARTGHLPTDATSNRTGLPGQGLLQAFRGPTDLSMVVVGLAFAVAVCVAAVVLARRDVLTWVAVAYLLFATTLGSQVWEVHAAFTRVLLPLYGLAFIAVVAAFGERRAVARAIPPRTVVAGTHA